MSTKYRYLFDTNIISEMVRNPQSVITDRIKEEGEASVCTSIIVACELRFGVAKNASKRLKTQLEAVLSAIDILPLEE